MLYIFAFIVSLVVTMILIPPIMKWADKIGAIDIPDARKVHTQAVPRVGGIAMVVGSVFSIILLADLDPQYISILAIINIDSARQSIKPTSNSEYQTMKKA